jgi:hypothetical protein
MQEVFLICLGLGMAPHAHSTSYLGGTNLEGHSQSMVLSKHTRLSLKKITKAKKGQGVLQVVIA